MSIARSVAEILTEHVTLELEILGVWRTVEEEPEALCYLVAYRDRAHRDECFTWVRQNPELEEYHRAGTFVAGRTRHMLQPTPYSPAQ